MFYRRLTDELLTAVDLTGAYAGCPIFIIGGNPVIERLPMKELEGSRLPTVALNNVFYPYPNPTMWMTADKPVCYGGHFFARPDIIKFAPMCYRCEQIDTTGRPLKDHPMMLFYSVSKTFDLNSFFVEVPALIPYMSLGEAILEERRLLPATEPPTKLKHSSETI